MRRENLVLLSFIGGLGGKNISIEEFEFIFDSLVKAVDKGEISPPQLLYTEAELIEINRLKNIVGKEKHYKFESGD